MFHVSFLDESEPIRVSLDDEQLEEVVSLQEEKSEIQVGFGTAEVVDVGKKIPPYDGEYDVTPGLVSQVLDTSGKRMSGDITVQEIPFTETGNLGGGYTAIIGGI